MLSFKREEKELVVLKTLNGPITINLTKTMGGQLRFSINAPKDVKIYREDMTVTG